MDSLAPRLAQQYKNLISDVNSLVRVAGMEEGEAEDTRAQALGIGGNIVQLIEQTCVQSVLPGSVKLLFSANTVAKVTRPRILDISIDTDTILCDLTMFLQKALDDITVSLPRTGPGTSASPRSWCRTCRGSSSPPAAPGPS